MTTLDIKTYVRKPFPVEALLITEENMELASQWCEGDIRSGKVRKDITEKYIQVQVPQITHANQARAFVGNYLVRSGNNFRVYTRKSFTSTFVLKDSILAEETAVA